MSRGKLFLTVLLAAATQLSAVCATSYRYVAARGDLRLISADGKKTLVLAKEGENTSWDASAVSPNGTIVALQSCDPVFTIDIPATKVYTADPKTGNMHLVMAGRIFHMYQPVWTDYDTLLLGRADKQGMDAGVYAVNIKTGQMKQVIPSHPFDEFYYDGLFLSPSKRLIAADMGTTAAEWLWVSDVDSGKRRWQTNLDRGMSGYSGFAWSSDSGTLFAAFYIDDEMASDSPGGIRKIDALTGKQTPWKYYKKSIDGIWSDPARKILIIERNGSLEVLNMADGKILHKQPNMQGPVVFLGGGKTLVHASGKQAVELGPTWKVIKKYNISAVPTGRNIRYSADRKAILYGADPNGTTGSNWVLDLSTGKATTITSDPASVDWLKHDIVR